MGEPAPTTGADLTLTDHQRRVGRAVDAAIDAGRHAGWRLIASPNIREFAEINALHQMANDLQRSVVIDLMAKRAGGRGLGRLLELGAQLNRQAVTTKLLASFAKRPLPFTRGDTAILLTLADSIVRNSSDPEAIGPASHAVGAAERVVGESGVGDLGGSIERLADALGAHHGGGSQGAKYRARLVALLGTEASVLDPHMVSDGDSWGETWLMRLPQVPAQFHPLLAHLTLVGSVEPTQKWKAEARTLVAARGAETLLHALLEDVESTRLHSVPYAMRSWIPSPDRFPVPTFQDRNALVLRGVIWASAMTRAEWVPDRLAAIGIVCGTSATGNNEAREVRLANACAAALGAVDSDAAFAALGRMKARIGNRNVNKQITKALEGAATRRGTTPSELLELAVPTMGLDRHGRRAEALDDHVASLSISANGEASLTWRLPDGTEKANPPKRIAEAHGADVRRLKDETKELRKALAMERGRVEDLFVEDRRWDIATWRERYVDHPLTGSFARRLIWRLVDPASGDAVSVMPDGDGFVGADGAPVIARDAVVIQLWHPIDAPESEVAAWRAAIMERQIRQPYKQAYRESYVLTPAEEATETYSNRFAAHILNYPQARALMIARRWATNFLGSFDGGDAGLAKRDFPSHGVRAEFFHDSVYPDAGEVVHCTTDQVRFIEMARGPGRQVPLREVPPIVLSEAMRDVDLFVGVSSIGADRNWQDAGQGRVARFDAYFEQYRHEELTASATVRRDAIAAMLPGLVIADRCELQDRWLRVRGDVRAYRIHLGSGNILMEPSDTYLCIVPARGDGPATRVFLPFDDDPLLALILSKAYLLANDRAIRDQSIIRQIEGR